MPISLPPVPDDVPAPAELWTVSMIAEYLGYTGDAATGSARRWLSRQGLEPVGREPGRRGESQYFEHLVRAARERSPGSGRREAPRVDGRFVRADEDG
jgi:hypothetical protein